MKYIKLLQNFYLSLSHRDRFVLLFFLLIIFIAIIYNSGGSNPNGWKKVHKLGISLPLKYSIHGIDVSHHNGLIDWRDVKRMRFTRDDLKLQFCFLKATEGLTHADRQFERNWVQVKKSGLIRGAYHFFIPWREPVGQAKNFINSVSLEKGDLAPVLDIEQNSLKPDKQIIEEIETWLNIVEKHYHKKPIIYTNPSFYKKFIKGNFDEYPLWIADYSNETLKGYPSNLWFWQHNQKGWCEGVKGTVDYNVFLGDEGDLEDLCL
ncbi:glycoside hydrolase family 25 protein [Arcicella rigui]|uniref:GH25 family lysozyme n=1 Tax=Arcicella rigui TaxID=797020 RepID=A0ABU5Q8U9_9BACT|nr:GH25 family lysozyme [Arcicella rigui]MEA5139265.1 GH25 family lysozyme [Arcicella rigui]